MLNYLATEIETILTARLQLVHCHYVKMQIQRKQNRNQILSENTCPWYQGFVDFQPSFIYQRNIVIRKAKKRSIKYIVTAVPHCVFSISIAFSKIFIKKKTERTK